MEAQFKKYRDDLEKLIKRGGDLLNALQFECRPKEARAELDRMFSKDKEKSKLSLSSSQSLTTPTRIGIPKRKA